MWDRRYGGTLGNNLQESKRTYGLRGNLGEEGGKWKIKRKTDSEVNSEDNEGLQGEKNQIKFGKLLTHMDTECEGKSKEAEEEIKREEKRH